MEDTKKRRTKFEIEIEEKFNEVLNILLPNYHDYDSFEFIIEFDETSEKPKSNIDEMLNFWFLPKIYGKIIKYKNVIPSLIVQDKMPMWVKVNLRLEKQIILTISKRYKGAKSIKEYHKENILQPFIIITEPKPELQKDKIIERFFSREKLREEEIIEIKKDEITIEGLKEKIYICLEKNNFYPNKFIAFSPVAPSYEGLVLHKLDNNFVIHEQIMDSSGKLIMLPDKIFTTFEEMITVYFNNFPTLHMLIDN